MTTFEVTQLDHLKEQQPPQPSSGDCWLLVMADMEERRQHGIAKYGVPVQPFNGRDPLVDAYQEALDQCVYLRQAIEEQNKIRELVIEIRRYVLRHGILLGECVAWGDLKFIFGVGQNPECPSERDA